MKREIDKLKSLVWCCILLVALAEMACVVFVILVLVRKFL